MALNSWLQVFAPCIQPRKADPNPSNIDDGLLIKLSEARYFVPPAKTHMVQSLTESFALATVFKFHRDAKTELTEKGLRQTIEDYENRDDVFNEKFLQLVIFQGIEPAECSNDARAYLRKLGNRKTLFISSPELLPGPYVAIGNQLRDVWKLVDDSYGTCMTTVKPQLNRLKPMEPFHLRSTDNRFLSFPLRSRLKTEAEVQSPLAGLRVVIKDNIDLYGIKSSVGNRAFYDTYPKRQKSAECIEKLIEQGVVILGKTKMTSFGNWEEPTEYIDYQAPWNPRADGYQSPGGSSSGSASAVGAYEWLDIAIGTDTWGSVTRPALWCGCFGLRPSMGAVSTKGVEPYVEMWDTPGILARDLRKCKDFATHWLSKDALQSNPKPFTSAIWPSDFWGIIDHEQQEIARDFIQTLEATLGVACENISFEEVWETHPPAQANGLSLPEFINPATATLAYDAYHNSQEFRERYREMSGHEPYTSPPNERVWSLGKSITREERDRGFRDLQIYKEWFEKTILSGKHANALVILPIESMAPRYRDQPPTFKRPAQDGVNALALAPLLRAPALSVPIGQVHYHSKVTDLDEKLPFSIVLMSRPGSDLKLIDTAIDLLKNAKKPISLEVGKELGFDRFKPSKIPSCLDLRKEDSHSSFSWM